MSRTQGQNQPERLLHRQEVEERTGLARSTIYEWMAAGRFPRPVRVGNRGVRWRERDVQRWVEGCIRLGHDGAEGRL